jgi:hypothetical protein
MGGTLLGYSRLAGILGLYKSVYHIFIIALYNGTKYVKSITKAFRSTLQYSPW